MLTFKDEDLGLAYTVETIEDLESAIRLHQAIHRTMQEASADLKAQLADVFKNIDPVQTPFMGARQIYPSSFTNGLGADKSIEQGDEALSIPLDANSGMGEWLSPRQISEPPTQSTNAETEALADAYQLQEHRQLQQEVGYLRDKVAHLMKKLDEKESTIEFVGQPPIQAANTGLTLSDQLKYLQEARTSLNMFNLDTSGVDAMLAQHGIHYHSVPKHFIGPGLGEMAQVMNAAPSKADVRMFQLWERFLEIMDANGFGDTPGEDRTSPDSYLSALEKWLVAFVQASEQLQEEKRKSANMLHEKENCQRQVQVFGAQAHGMRNELGECKAEIIALKKGISKLQQKRDRSKVKHTEEIQNLLAERDLNKAEVSRMGDLYRQMQNQRDGEKHAREMAVNDNIELSKRNKLLQEKIDFCLRVVPTLESAWQTIPPHELKHFQLQVAERPD